MFEPGGIFANQDVKHEISHCGCHKGNSLHELVHILAAYS